MNIGEKRGEEKRREEKRREDKRREEKRREDILNFNKKTSKRGCVNWKKRERKGTRQTKLKPKVIMHFVFLLLTEWWREVKVLNSTQTGEQGDQGWLSFLIRPPLSLCRPLSWWLHLLSLNLTCCALENASWLVGLITGSSLTRAGPRPRQNTDSTWAPHRPAPHTNEY